MKKTIIILILGFAFTGYASLYPQVNPWIQKNSGLPATPSVRAICRNTSGDLFIGVDNHGVYRSENGGNLWVESNTGLSTTSVWDLIHVTGNRLIAATLSGIYLSTDNGVNWSQKTTQAANALRISATGDILAGLDEGIAKSTDSGLTWFMSSGGLPTAIIRSLTSDQEDNQGLYAATDQHGIFKSTDNGNFWFPVNQGITDTSVMFFSIVFNSDNELFTGYNDGLYYSSDFGNTWSEIYHRSGRIFKTLAFTQNGQIFRGDVDAGVHLSTDNGSSWDSVSNGLTNGYIMELVIPDTGLIYAGTGDGFFVNDSYLYPTAPANLIAEAVGARKINLMWNRSANNPVSYFIYRSNSVSGNFSLIDMVTAPDTVYTNTGLNPSTEYYYTIIASNTWGSSPTSGVDSATTLQVFVDPRDGREYSMVTIGTQTWMAENLMATKYRNGDDIPNVTDNGTWSGLSTGGYCDYGNDTNNSNIYGRLYNWHAVNDIKGLAPLGWKIPSDADWDTLIAYLGGSNIAGGKLKETGSFHWNVPNTGATNETGFTALPGGHRFYDGTFNRLGLNGYGWSNTVYNVDTTQAWRRRLSFDSSNIQRDFSWKKNGFAVRCIQSNLTEPPSLTSFSPSSGPVGTTITISGLNFNTTPSNNIVYFGAMKAAVTGGNSTQLTVTVPAGATYAPITVTDTTTGLTSYSSSPFRIIFGSTGSIDAGSFAGKVDFTVGATPYNNDLALGDLDGDGKTDIAVANQQGNVIAVLRNTGTAGSVSSGSFAPKVDFSVGQRVLDVAIGDLDGDGKPDMVSANADNNTISVLRNTSTPGIIDAGSFAPKVNFTTGGYPYSVAIRDFDGDGKPDIAVVNNNSSTLSIFKNQCAKGVITDTSFASKIDFATSSGPFYLDLSDLDGDGKPDIVTGGTNTTLSVFRNTCTPGIISSGSFDTRIEFTTGGYPARPAIGDLDGDGKADLAVSNYGTDNFSVLRNNGIPGTVRFIPRVDFASNINPAGIALGDCNGDGKTDIVVTGSNNTVSVFKNLCGPDTITSGSFPLKVDFTAGTGTASVVAGDLDGDGKTDIVSLNSLGTPSVSVFRNQAVAAPSVTSFSPVSGPVATVITINGSDFNSALANNIVYFGGVRATVTGGNSTQLTVTVPAGAAYGPISVTDTATHLTGYSPLPFTVTFSNTAPLDENAFSSAGSFATRVSPWAVSLADIDGDGKLDALVPNYGTDHYISVLRNTGNPGTVSFAAKSDFASAGAPASVKTADFDGDGKLDIAVTAINDGILAMEVFPNLSVPGSITLGTKTDLNTVASANPTSAVGDINGDGKPDIVVANGNHYLISLFINNSGPGSVSFSSAIDLATTEHPAAGALADFDGDGKTDMLIVSANANSISVYRNISTADSVKFASKTDFTTGATPMNASAADLDHDGKYDIVVTDYEGNTVSVFRNTCTPGNISFSSRTVYGAATHPVGISLEDIDGDGKIDIITGHQSDSVSVFRNEGSAGNIAFGSRINYSAPNTPLVAAAGDIDGDGKPDILFNRNTASAVGVLRNVMVAPPVIHSFSPLHGPVGTSVIISGSGFNPIAADNMVHFGGIKANVLDADSAQLLVTVPAGASYGPVTVTETTTGLTAFSGQAFAVTFSGQLTINGSIFGEKIDLPVGSNPQLLAVTDVDGDGKPDLASCNSTISTVSLFRNVSVTGTLTAGSFEDTSHFPTGISPNDIAFGDLNGDGKPDMATPNSGDNTVSVLMNTSVTGSINAGSFAGKVDFAVGNSPRRILIGDADLDGRADILVTDFNDHTVSILRNTGTKGIIHAGSFATAVSYSTGTNPHGFALGDVDHDGKPDLVVVNHGAHTLSVLKNLSSPGTLNSGSFAGKVDFSTGSYPNSLALGDLDGDGRDDIAVTNSAANTISVFRNAGINDTVTSGSFETPVVFTAGTYPYGITFGMMNGDHKPDMIVANANGASISVYQNNSTAGSITSGSFGDSVNFSAGPTPYIAVPSDLDGDGKPDLAVTVYGANALSVFRNITPSVPAAPNNLDAFTNTSSQIRLSWQPGSGNPDKYFIHRSANYHGTYFLIDSVTALHTDWTDTGLTASTKYFYKINATNMWGSSSFSNIDSAVTYAPEPVAQPYDIAFSGVTSSSFNVIFKRAAGNPDGYIVLRTISEWPELHLQDGLEYSPGDSNDIARVVSFGADTMFSQTDLTAGTQYRYIIFSFNGNGLTTNYRTSSALTGVRYTYAVEPQDQPANLSFLYLTDTSFTVSFDETAGSGENYIAIRRIGNPPTGLPADGDYYNPNQAIGDGLVVFTGNGTTFDQGYLSPGTTYHYLIFSYNGVGETNNYLTTSPLSGSITTNGTSEPPTAPYNLDATAVSDSRITLSWRPSSGNPDQYVIHRSMSYNGVYSIIDTVTAPDTAATDTGLTASTKYFYEITAINSQGSSSASNIDSATTFGIAPTKPVNFSAAAVDHEKIKLTWSRSSNQPDLYRIYRSYDPGVNGYDQLDSVQGTDSTYTDQGLNENKVVWYCVQAVNGWGISPFSDEDSARTFYEPPAFGETPVFSPENPGINQQVVVGITITGSPSSVTLRYGHNSDFFNFVEKNMTLYSGAYIADIPSDFVKEDGAWIRIIASNMAGTFYYPGVDKHYGVPLQLSTDNLDTLMERSTRGWLKGVTIGCGTYWLVSLPGNTDLNLVSAWGNQEMTSRGPLNWRAVEWDTLAHQFRDITVMNSNKAYFIWNLNKVNPFLYLGACTTNKLDLLDSVRLAPGWNIIPNPYTFLLSFDIIDTLIDQHVYWKTVSGWQHTTMIQPFYAFALYNRTSRTIRLSDAISINGLFDKPSIQKQAGLWNINFAARAGSFTDEDNFIGAASSASTGNDPLDIHKPFDMGDGICLHFNQDGKPMAADIRPVSENVHSWDMTVNNHTKLTSVTLDWENTGFPDNHAAWLADIDNNAFIDLRQQNIYNFKSQKEHHFKILAGDADHITEELALLKQNMPERFSLHPNFPNPFNPNTTIRFDVAKTGKVKLYVYNVLGQLVTILVSGTLETGKYDIQWNGKDNRGNAVSSGIYIYRLVAGGYVKARKMVLVR